MALLNKVRCFVLDDTTGRPCAGVAVSLTADGDSGARTLGILASDRAGYLAFDLSRTTLLSSETKLWLTPLGEPKSRLDVLAQPIASRPDSWTAGSTSGKRSSRDQRYVATTAGTRASLPPTVGPSDASVSHTCFTFLLHVKSKVATSTAGDDCGTAVLPAVQSPDPCDYRLSPGSFVTSVSKLLGDGCCESLVPSTLPVQEYILRRVIT